MQATLYRDIVHLSLGGQAIRLRLSNEYGQAPLVVSSVHVATSAGASATQPGTDHLVLFGGLPSVTLSAGSMAVSDPVIFPVPSFANLAVSMLVPAQASATLTWHPLAMSTNYMSEKDNIPEAAELHAATPVTSWYLLKGVEVQAAADARAVVILGASISDGFRSTPDANTRWPDDLAVRLQANPATAHVGVLNEGISGNRLLHDDAGPSAISRLDRDVLAQPGARFVIVSLGTNDIGRTFFPLHPNETVTAADLIWCLQQIALRAHARGLKVIAGTLNPFRGAAYFTPAGEAMRQAFNTFIRTSHDLDAFIDFDQATRDPAHPEQLAPALDSGDHLHPNDAGYKAMADSINLKLFLP